MVLLTISNNWAFNDIYALSPDDLEPVPLITEAFAQFPVASPENSDSAFVTLLAFSTDIVMFHLAERNFVTITRNDAHEAYPRWSSDGDGAQSVGGTAQSGCDD